MDKQNYCDLKVVNNTEHYVAFKVFFIYYVKILTFVHSLRIIYNFFFFVRLKPHRLRSISYDRILVLYNRGIHVSSEVILIIIK